MDGQFPHSDRAHALLSASKASRWMNCPGSVRLTADIPDKSSSYAEEGTRAHELAEALYSGATPPADVDPDMLDHAQAYLDYLKEVQGNGLLLVENRVSYSDYVKDGFGTADAIILSEDGHDLHIVDLKYGKGVEVAAEGNPQLRCYAVGALKAAQYLSDEISEVTVHVFQPRLHHIDTETLSVEELLGWADAVLAPAAVATEAEDARLTPGETQCRFCPAKATCPALAADVVAHVHGVEELATKLSKSPNRLDAEGVAELLPHAALAKSWAKAVEEHAHSLALSGQTVPGQKLIRGKMGTRAWTDTEAALTALKKSKFKIDEVAPRKVLSPTQAEELFGKGKLPVALTDLVHAPEGKLTLVSASHKKPAVVIDPSAGFTPATT